MAKPVGFLGICTLLLTALGILFLTYERSYVFLSGHKYSYDDVDDYYPGLQVWRLPLEPVHLSYENTVHYPFDTEFGDEEWNTTLPTGGALLHLGSSFRPFTLGMFHEIRCLNIIRKTLANYYADSTDNAAIEHSELAQHCMNYLRQMVLCRSSLNLEPVRAAKGNHVTVWDITHTCRDWEAVYEAAEKNYQEYLTHTMGQNVKDDK